MFCKTGVEENNNGTAKQEEDEEDEHEEDESKNSSAESILRDFNYKLRCMISERSRKLKATLCLSTMFSSWLFLVFRGQLLRGQELTQSKNIIKSTKWKSMKVGRGDDMHSQ